MSELFNVLVCVLGSRHLGPQDLPDTPFWHRLPGLLRDALTGASGAAEDLRVIMPRVRQAAAVLKQSPDWGTRGVDHVGLRLGLLYIGYRAGRIDPLLVLTKAFHVADSHVCDVDPRLFLSLRAALAAGQAAEDQIGLLFAPYVPLAEQTILEWGLHTSGSIPAEDGRAEPGPAPDRCTTDVR